MKTAEAIEGMTDPGEFEILAIRVLRMVDDDCRALEHMGVTAEGKTVPNPIDGFCRIPNTDPPRFVLAAATTTKPGSLETKWLFDHKKRPKAKKASAADDGDLVKAARRAEEIRRNHPNAAFVVCLCSNRQPDDDFMARVYKRGEQLGLEVRILARSRLRDFLDTTPDGQWLRKEHLGIQAERLSLSLLRELCGASLNRYGKEFPINPPETFVDTSFVDDLIAAINSRKSVHVVTGVSGSGKSVACYQVLRRHLETGGTGLWIPGEILARASSLEDAVGLTLRLLSPAIEPGAGAIAFRLQAGSRRLLLVIDDINRRHSPSQLLGRVIAWGRPVSIDKTKEIAQLHVVVVPAWDQTWAPLDQQYQGADWLSRLRVMRMNEPEAVACLSAVLGPEAQDLADADPQQIVASLGYDPILITMYADLAKRRRALDPLSLSRDVIGRFVAEANADAAVSGTFLESEYNSVQARLAKELLTNRDLSPRWDNLAQWLSAEDVKAIRELAQHKKICRVTGQEDEIYFEFRHDRILEYHLVRTLESMIADPRGNSDVLSDPFYADFVGQALASARQSDDLLSWVKQHTPLALISALCFLTPACPGADAIESAGKVWLQSASQDPLTPRTALIEAYRLLAAMDSTLILNVTHGLRPDALLSQARLANGDARAGVTFFSRCQWFSPAVNDQSLDGVLRRALRRHRQKLIRECGVILEDPNVLDAERRGALVLAGFIGDVALAASIRTAWESTDDKTSLLLPALWAGLRCAVDNPAATLDEMMGMWAHLPGDDQDGHISERQAVAHELQFALRRGIEDPLLRYLVEKAREVEALRWAIVCTLQYIDHPLVVRFLVEEAADIDQRLKKSGGFSPWSWILRDQWDPTSGRRGGRLSAESVQVLRHCWESEGEWTQLRETAFRFWVYAVDDLDVLRSISSEHPQFRSVLWRRAMLGDISVVPMVRSLLPTDGHWFHVVSKVWTQEFQDSLDQALLDLKKVTKDDSGEKTDMHYMLAELLRDIPAVQAQSLLAKHWSHLRYSPLFVQVALYLGTPKSVTLARGALRDFTSPADPFAHIGRFFGFFTTGLMDRLNLQHLEVLQPYLNRLDDVTLSDMAQFCERRGYREWGWSHLKPEFDRRRALLAKVSGEDQDYIERVGRLHFPSDVDLLEELDWIEEQGPHAYGHLHFWSEGFDRRQDDRGRWRRILEAWLEQAPGLERFRLYSYAVLDYGTRGDLAMLSSHEISGDKSEIDCLKGDATFGVMRRSLH